jgi:hypothetical protein
VAIARYDLIGDYDWVASPIMEFLYGVDRPDEVPAYVTPKLAWELRQSYRHRYMQAFIPDGAEKAKRTREWWESAGVAINRRLWGYRVDTTPEQDLAFLAYINASANRHHYSINKANCDNFAVDVINFYYPGTVPKHGDRIADFGWMTPKYVARRLAAYGKAHPATNMKVIEVPQVPGSLRRSRPVRGAVESGLKTKRYLAALMVLQPELPPTLAVLYLIHGHWQIGQGAEEATPEDFEICPQCATQTAFVPRAGEAGDQKSLMK